MRARQPHNERLRRWGLRSQVGVDTPRPEFCSGASQLGQLGLETDTSA